MSKLTNYYKQFKEMRKEPRKKALTTLIMYLVFFTIMFSLLGIINLFSEPAKPEIIRNNPIEQLKNLNNYSYVYEIQINEETNLITGKRFLNQEAFQYNEDNYYITASTVFKVDDSELEEKNPFVIDIFQFSPNKIYDYIKEAGNSNQNENEYTIPLSNFFEEKNPSELVQNQYIKIKLIETTEDDFKLILDLSNYANYINNEIINYQLDITYYDINQTNEFDLLGNDI